MTQRDANARYRATERGRETRKAAHKRYRDSPAGKASAARRKALNAEYVAIHQRLRKERGKASDHSCVDCGGQAQDWSYDEPTGHSDDLGRYQPRCRSCHAKHDRT